MSVRIDDIFSADPSLNTANPLAKQAARWGTKWCHLWAETEEDLPKLHEIALKIGLKRTYFQNRKDFPHYDLIPSKRVLAIKHGAVETNLREWVRERMRNALTTR